MARQPVRVVAKLAPHPLELLEHDAGVMEEGASGRRRADGAAPTVEQRHAERLLHATDTSARGGERDMAAVRAAGNASGFGNMAEETQIGQIETHRDTPARLARPSLRARRRLTQPIPN